MSDDIDMSDWTDEQREEWRLNELCDPLFAMWLRFESAFARIAIDKYDVSDEDAEKFASRMEASDTDAGRAFAYMMRRIAHGRRMRRMGHMVEAIWAARGNKGMIALADVRAEYDKLNRGDA